MKFQNVRRSCASRWRLLASIAAAGLLGLSSSAHGHQLWLEQANGGTRLYFGEFGDNLHEVSPGYLDKLSRPAVRVVSANGEKPLEVKKVRDGIVIEGRAGKGEVLIAADEGYPLMESKDGDKVVRNAWTPAARFMPELSAAAPKLTLDVVPTNGNGEFQVVFRGAPLAGAEVSLTAVSGWSLRGRTDAQGKVRFQLPWKASYALLVRHKEAKPGKRRGAQGAEESFETASFATTLTFVTSSGLQSPPAPPPAPPNELPKS